MLVTTPVTAEGARGLAAIIDDPGGALLGFDYDGVLAPIVDDPERSPPHPRAVPALARLARHVGAVVIITGRPAEVAVAYGRFHEWPSLRRLVVFGHYGHERWDAETGDVIATPPPPAVATARRDLPALLKRLAIPGARLEDKGSALAVHTRGCPNPAAALESLRAPLAEFAAEHDLGLEPGRFVLEIRPTATDKGATLCSYVEASCARAVAYTGDDLGDLSAFAAVDAMRARGLPGLKVCSGSAEVVEVARQADVVVDGPAGVVELVNGIADSIESR